MRIFTEADFSEDVREALKRARRGVSDGGVRLFRVYAPHTFTQASLDGAAPLHDARIPALYRFGTEFLSQDENASVASLGGYPAGARVQLRGQGLVIRADIADEFEASRMRHFWKFTEGGWHTQDNSPIRIAFDLEDARDEFVRFLTNLFGDWHFHLSAQERSLDDAKTYVKRQFAKRLHEADAETYPEPPALGDLPTFDKLARAQLLKLRNGKPADNLTLEELAWRTECGVKDALKPATTEAELLAATELMTEGVLTAAGFNNVSDADAFWTIRDGISPVWQHDIADQGNAYLAAEARLLAGYLNTESHHPAPLAVIEAVANKVGGQIHTRTVR